MVVREYFWTIDNVFIELQATKRVSSKMEAVRVKPSLLKAMVLNFSLLIG